MLVGYLASRNRDIYITAMYYFLFRYLPAEEIVLVQVPAV